MDEPINSLVGKTIKNIYMSDEYLKFDTDQGRFRSACTAIAARIVTSTTS